MPRKPLRTRDRRVLPWLLFAGLLSLGTLALAGPTSGAPAAAGEKTAPPVGGTSVVVTASDAPQPNDAGLATAFNAWATNCGLTGCTFAWTWGDGSAATTAQHTNHTYYAPGSYEVTCWANSSVLGGTDGVQSLSVLILSQVSLQARGTPTTADVGEHVLLVARVSGGTAPLSVVWRLYNSSTLKTRDVNASFAASGTFSNQVWANDSRGSVAHAWWNLTVNPDPHVSEVATPTTLDAGELGNFSATTAGGTAPVLYAWAFGNGTFANGSALRQAFLSPGVHPVRVWANDSAGVSSTSFVDVTVLPGLAAVPSVRSDTTLEGTPLHFTGSVAGGNPPYTFAWTFGDGNFADTQNATHTYGAVGTYPVSFWVNDSMGHSAHGYLTIHVNSAVAVSVSASTLTTDVGRGITFQATPSGGEGAPYNVTWSFGDGSFGVGSPITHAYAFSDPAPYVVWVWANDSLGNSGSASISVTVNPSLTLRAGAASPSTDVGVADQLVASVAGGTAPVQYKWILDDGTVSALSTLSRTFTQPGTHREVVWANDSAGASDFASLTVQVNADLSANPFGGSPSVTAGKGIELTGNFTGGTPPYQFLWALGVPNSWATNQSLSATYENPGVYTARFWVNDSVGRSATGLVSVTVIAPKSNGTTAPPGSGGSPTYVREGWLVVLLVFVVVAALLVVYLSRRRRLGSTSGLVGASPAGAISPPSGGPSGTGPASFLPAEEADFTGVGDDLPPWPSGPFCVFEGVDRSLLYRTASARAIDPHTLFVLTLSEPEVLRTAWAMEGATIWQVSRLEGPERISPGEIDRIAHLAETHLGEAPGRSVLVDATESLITATGETTTARFFHVLHQVADTQHGKVIAFLNPRQVTLQERRSLEEGAEKVRFGPRTATGSAGPPS